MKPETLVLLGLAGVVAFLLYKQSVATSAEVTTDLTSSRSGVPSDPASSTNVVNDLVSLVSSAFSLGDKVVQSFSKTT
jgi:hypothetical protein